MLDNANCQAKGICWAVQMTKQEGYHHVVIEDDAKWWFYFIY
jgi:hypothetical protein